MVHDPIQLRAWESLLRLVVQELADGRRTRIELIEQLHSLVELLESRTRTLVDAAAELDVESRGAVAPPRELAALVAAELVPLLSAQLGDAPADLADAVATLSAQLEGLVPDEDGDDRVSSPLQAMDLRLIELLEGLARVERQLASEADLDRAHIEAEKSVRLAQEHTRQTLLSVTIGAGWFRALALLVVLAGLQVLGFAAVVDHIVGAPVSVLAQ